MDNDLREGIVEKKKVRQKAGRQAGWLAGWLIALQKLAPIALL